MRKKILFGAIFFALLLLLGGSFLLKQQSNELVIAAEVDENLANLSVKIEEEIKNNTFLSFSSNPYDYAYDSEYFSNIVELGIDAVPVLRERLEDSTSDGLEEYVMAIAIEEITNCDLKELEGYEWSTANEFTETWDNFVEEASENVDTILQDTVSVDEKIEKIKPYGIFAAEKTQEYMQKNKKKEDIKKLESYCKDLDVSKADVKKIRKW